MSAPDISPRSVRAALRQLSAERLLTDSPLAELVLIAQTLERLGRPNNRASRQWALGQVLNEAVEGELAHLRQRRAVADARGDRPTIPSDAPAAGPAHERFAGPDLTAAALDRLRRDFQHDDPVLEGCSAVYHLFLRPDLGLTTSRLASLVPGRHARTVQRRLGLGLDRISRRLQALEAAAVAEHRRRLLLDRLPAPAGGRLFGADRVVAALGDWLADANRAQVLVLSGPAGSGKSTAAAALLRPVLAASTVTRVAWLGPADRRPQGSADGTALTERLIAQPAVRELPPSGPFATAMMTDQRQGAAAEPRATDALAGPGRASATLHALRGAIEAIGRQPGALLVIDGVDDAREMWTIARHFGPWRATPRVLITSRLGWGAFALAENVVMPPLDRGASLALLRNEGRRRGLPSLATASDAALAALVEAAAGHPGALLLAVSELRTAPVGHVAARFRAGIGRAGILIARLWAAPWRQAPDAVRRAVQAVADLEHTADGADEADGAEAAAVAAALGGSADDIEAALCAALDLGLVVITDGHPARFRTPPFLAAWLAGGAACAAETGAR